MAKISMLPTLFLFLLLGCADAQREKESTRPHEFDPWALDFKVVRHQLSNGLTLLTIPNHQLPIYSAFIFYDVGSKYESPGQTGASHFLEHLMFKGAKKFGPGVFDKSIEAAGGNSNAYTTNDQTVYHENMPKDSLDAVMDMEGDRMENLLLEPTAFEKERMVILEERKMRYENSPDGKIFMEMMKEVFNGTPYGESVIGSIDDVSKVSRDQIQAYFKTHYAPNNAVIVVTGDVDPDYVAHLVDRSFGSIDKNDKLPYLKKEFDDPHNYKLQDLPTHDSDFFGQSPTPLFRYIFQGEKAGTRRALVLDLLASMLSDGKASHIYQRFAMGKSPVVSNIFGHNYNLKHSGIFYIGGELLKGVDLTSFKQSLRTEVKGLCDKALTPKALERTKNQYLTGYYQGLQTNEGVSSFIGQRESMFGDYLIYKKELQTYRDIQLPEIKTQCDEMLAKHEGHFLTVWDKNKKK